LREKGGGVASFTDVSLVAVRESREGRMGATCLFSTNGLNY
jgi:hypothetical protein